MQSRGIRFEICAPTGRAAKRLSEATSIEARTIHRLLEFTGETFLKDEDDPIDTDVIVVDETSMVDSALLFSLLKATKIGTNLIFVGDKDQLPSVGAGNVLSDLIESDILNYIELKHIFRQSQNSNIVTNAHLINKGEMPVLELADDFAFSEKASPAQTLNTLLNILYRNKLGNPWIDLQILSPTKKGILGVNNINIEIQKLLNPAKKNKTEVTFNDNIFRVGDKIMQIKNNYKLEWEQPDLSGIKKGVGVFNGDIGIIKEINKPSQHIHIEFDDGRHAYYNFNQLAELELAYCISIHKSQGSEFPKVIIPLYSGPPMLMTRNLLYTAITRACSYVVLLGKKSTIAHMVSNLQEKNRFSALAYFLKETSSLFLSLQ